MIDAFKEYFYILIHPFDSQLRLREKILLSQTKDIPSSLRYYEAIAISWIFSIIESLLTIFLIFISWHTLRHFPMPWSITSRAAPIGLLLVLIPPVLFPLTSYFYIQIWWLSFTFFIPLFTPYINHPPEGKMDGPTIKKILDQTLISSFCPNALKLFPVFGNTLRNLASPFYIYAGLKESLGLPFWPSFIIVLSPLFIASTFFLLVLLFVILTFYH